MFIKLLIVLILLMQNYSWVSSEGLTLKSVASIDVQRERYCLYYSTTHSIAPKPEYKQLHYGPCKCDERPCTKLCCNRDYFLNTSSHVCEKMPTTAKKYPTDLEIKPNNASELKIVNIFSYFMYELGLPCNKPEVLHTDDYHWNLKGDGTLFSKVLDEEVILTTEDYCLSPYFVDNTKDYVLTAFSCPVPYELTWDLYLNTYGMILSVIFLIPTVVIYLVKRELRGNIRGKLIICYLGSLSVGYAIISFINLSEIRFGFMSCSLLGFVCYFFVMSAFLWLSVISYEIWSNFRENYYEFDISNVRKRFMCYSAYAWGLALLMTLIALIVQSSDGIDKKYKPGIGTEYCWLNIGQWSAAIYLYGPNLILLLLNCATFIILIVKIYRLRYKVQYLTNAEKLLQDDALDLLRLFLIMSLSWILDILSYCMHDLKGWSLLFTASNLCNALQGVSIFFVFAFKLNKFLKTPI